MYLIKNNFEGKLANNSSQNNCKFACTSTNLCTETDGSLMVNESLDCPEFSKDNFRMAEEFSFWVEGVFQVSKNSAFRLISSLNKSSLVCED